MTRRLGLLFVLLATTGGTAYAQADLTGIWQPRFHEDFPERIPGPELGDYLGLPINPSARRWAESWDPSRITLPEEQCRVHTSPYIHRGPLNMRIWSEKDDKTQEITAIKIYISTYEQTRTIWMDGREHPGPNAPHTWMGFSTGKWEGDMLTVTTTHIKQNWHRRNGVPQSDRTTMIDRFIRTGDILTHITVTTDPVFLTEPLVKSQNFALQRERDGDGVLPIPLGSRRRRPSDDHDDRRRPDLPDAALHHEFRFQEGAGQLEVEPGGVQELNAALRVLT